MPCNTFENRLLDELIQVEELLSGLQRYQELKASVVQLGQKREKLAALVKLKKKTKEKVEETVVLETRRVKESIEQLKEEIWRLEENELRRLLDLQNCDETSVFESRLIAFKKDEVHTNRLFWLNTEPLIMSRVNQRR